MLRGIVKGLSELGSHESTVLKAGQSIESFTQDVAHDAIRLYRGEGPRISSLQEMSDDMVGRYFTPELSSAMNYVNEAADRKLLYVDVPKGELFERGIRADYETVLPREIADRAKPYIHRPPQNAIIPQKPSSGRMGGVPTRSRTQSKAHYRKTF